MFSSNDLAALEATKIRSRSRLIVEGRTADGYFAAFETPAGSFPTVCRHKATIGVDYWLSERAAVLHCCEFLEAST